MVTTVYYFDGMTTPIGRVHVVVNDVAVVRLYLPGTSWSERYVRAPHHPMIVQVKQELREYWSGARVQFSLPVHLEGTDFQLSVWRALRKIPYGKTRTYHDIATTVGRPSAVRAVGSAIGKNPTPIIIPCHRVIRSDGAIGGYAGGPTLKMQLLALEQEGRGSL